MSDFPPADLAVVDVHLDPKAKQQYVLLRINWDGGAPPIPPPIGLSDNALGIDISHYQSDNKKPIDWAKVKQVAQVQYVFIKASEGAREIDGFLVSHRNGAANVGIPYGFYHYLRDNVSGEAQADYFLSALAGDVGNLPLVLDVEEGAPPLVEVRKMVDRLQERVDGKAIMIYTRASKWVELGSQRAGAPDFSDCLLWIAHPNAVAPTLPPSWIGYDFWQINWATRIPGIEGMVDVNKFRGSAPRPWWIKDMKPNPAFPTRPPSYSVRPAVNGAAVRCHKTPNGAFDRTLNITWVSDVYEVTLDGWLRVSLTPELWAEEKHFK